MRLTITILRTALAVVGLLCSMTVLFSISAYDKWWIRVFDYPRLQITILSAVVLALSFFLFDLKRRWSQLCLVMLTVAVIWQAYLLHPYFLPVQVEVPNRVAQDSQRLFSILVANVLMENQEVQSYLKLVDKNDPDIVLVIEPNARWTEQLEPLRKRYPHQIEQPQENHYGMNLYSRFPLSETNIYYYRSEEENIPSIYTVLNLPSGDEIEFYGVHPRPPLPENSVAAADRALMTIAKQAREAERPVLVAGDFNDVPWSFTLGNFQEISQLRNLRVGRGFYNTFDTRHPILRLPIDHIYPSRGLGLVEIAKPEAFSSDHMALFARFVVDESVK